MRLFPLVCGLLGLLPLPLAAQTGTPLAQTLAALGAAPCENSGLTCVNLADAPKPFRQ